MNRRTFTQVLATAALGVAAPPLQSRASSAAAEPDARSTAVSSFRDALDGLYEFAV